MNRNLQQRPDELFLNGDRIQGDFTVTQTGEKRWQINFSQGDRTLCLYVFDSESAAGGALLDHLKHLSSLRLEHGPMTVALLKSELDREGINPIRYSLSGEDFPGDWFVLEKGLGGKWSVYYTERGGRDQEFFFDAEAPACEYMLTLLIFSARRYPSLFC